MSTSTHERGVAVDEKIFEATLDLLATNGFLNLSIAKIAEKAEVNKTTVYRRHKTIESIVLSAASSLASKKIALPDTGSLLQDFKILARSVKQLLESPLGQALIHATALSSLVELRRAYWSSRLRQAAVIIDNAHQRSECSEVRAPWEWIESLVAPIHFRVFQTQGRVTVAFLNRHALRVYEDLLRAHPPER